MNRATEKKLISLRDKILKHKEKIEELSAELKRLCPHESYFRSGGDMWHDWPDYGRYPYYYECTFCGIIIKSQHGDRELDEKVVKGK